MSIKLNEFIERFSFVLPGHLNKMPWEIIDNLSTIITQLLQMTGEEFVIKDGIAIHKTALIEQNVVIKGPAIVGAKVSIGANAYLRGPLLLDESVHIGAGCEIKHSVIFSGTAVAHFNYIGNSIVGSDVNFEAGSVAANHYNEREDKVISVVVNGEITNTGVKKFGSLVGDNCRIGANAVLSPGTILRKKFVVKRLELIEQLK
jgi:NDP-sugar pyrophosphorylase family protein